MRRSPGERGFFAVLALVLFIWAVQLSLLVAGVWCAAHFIRKYW